MLAPDFLSILRCPDDRSTLVEADDAMVAALNGAIAARKLRNRGGDVVERSLDGALVRADRTLAYPIIDGIPVLLVDEAIRLGEVISG